MIVWIVYYRDYDKIPSVDQVFDSREKAEEYIKLQRRPSWYSFESWKVQ